MIWLTLRQFRTQAAVAFGAVVAVAFVLAITGRRLVELARSNANIYDGLTGADRNLFFAGLVLMAVAPPLIGAFWGAPLVARELETGTHRLVWNQSVTRTRWLAVKLGVGVLASALVVGLLSLAVSWWADPIDGARSESRGGLPARLTPVTFAMRGVAPVGYAVFALVLGVAVGILIRRTLPAMAITLAVCIFAQIAMPLWVRPHLVAPVAQTVTLTRSRLGSIQADGDGTLVKITLNTGGPDSWVLSNETVGSTGKAARLPSWMSACFPPPSAPIARQQGQKVPAIDACFARLTAEGYRQHVVYQPAKHFWPLQWAETALYLALSGLLAAFCFWWTRRRLS